MSRGDAVAPDARVGPLLFLQGAEAGRLRLSAIVLTPVGAAAPVLETDDGSHDAEAVLVRYGWRVWRYAFALPATGRAFYTLGGERFPVMADLTGDLRIAYASCNGQEDGDGDRAPVERNAMWHRLAEDHATAPFGLLLLGGDQIYADEVVLAHPLSAGWPEEVPEVPEARAEELRAALAEAMFARYVELLAETPAGWVMARVPSVAMWDDHDICDGWGSRPVWKLDSTLGRTLFDVAREHFFLFQLGAAPGVLPASVIDRTGTSLTTHFHLPGLYVLSPDLRSERRPERVMGEAGWAALATALERVCEGRLLVLSSVPALGPRLSLVEKYMGFTPWVEKYEDDLRDQWQSRTHRDEWKRFLTTMVDVHRRPDVAVTFLSGEIHLATRGTMATEAGPVHQLVSSGVAHPPPPWAYARTLGGLARFGVAPLPASRIRLHPLPGRRTVYRAERNYLVLTRRAGAWSAGWILEDSGPTPELGLGKSA